MERVFDTSGAAGILQVWTGAQRHTAAMPVVPQRRNWARGEQGGKGSPAAGWRSAGPRAGTALRAHRRSGSGDAPQPTEVRPLHRLMLWKPAAAVASTDCCNRLLRLEEFYIDAAPVAGAGLRRLARFAHLNALYLVRAGSTGRTLAGPETFGALPHLVREASEPAKAPDALRRTLQRIRRRGCVLFCWR